MAPPHLASRTPGEDLLEERRGVMIIVILICAAFLLSFIGLIISDLHRRWSEADEFREKTAALGRKIALPVTVPAGHIRNAWRRWFPKPAAAPKPKPADVEAKAGADDNNNSNNNNDSSAPQSGGEQSAGAPSSTTAVSTPELASGETATPVATVPEAKPVNRWSVLGSLNKVKSPHFRSGQLPGGRPEILMDDTTSENSGTLWNLTVPPSAAVPTAAYFRR